MKLFQPVSSDGDNDAKCPFYVFAEDAKKAKEKAIKFIEKYQQDEVVYNFFAPKGIDGHTSAIVDVIEVFSKDGVFIP